MLKEYSAQPPFSDFEQTEVVGEISTSAGIE